MSLDAKCTRFSVTGLTLPRKPSKLRRPSGDTDLQHPSLLICSQGSVQERTLPTHCAATAQRGRPFVKDDIARSRAWDVTPASSCSLAAVAADGGDELSTS